MGIRELESFPRLASVMLVCLACITELLGQAHVVEYKIPFRSKQFSAVVVAQNDEPIADVSVEWLTAGWKKVRTTTNTNSRGFFSFRISKPGLYWLRLTASGFNQSRMKLRISKRVRTWPKLTMEIAH
jgi:hypothetical protein